MSYIDKIKDKIKRFKINAFFSLSRIGLRGLITLDLVLIINIILAKFKINRFVRPLHCFIKGYRYPIIVRYGTSDYDVFNQIFIENEFDLLTNDNFKLIIDCGAYVGYSALYFLKKFPDTHVIAIEPDALNFDICKKNLSAYRKRITLINSAVYPIQTRLIVCRGQYRDGREWTTQVRPCKDNEKSNISSVVLASLIEKSGFSSVDLLKIDIERGEFPLFSENYEQWLAKVKNIAIELHDEECKDVFFKALSDYNFEIFRSGELTICKNIHPKQFTLVKS